MKIIGVLFLSFILFVESRVGSSASSPINGNKGEGQTKSRFEITINSTNDPDRSGAQVSGICLDRAVCSGSAEALTTCIYN
jgi:hypothetical protein